MTENRLAMTALVIGGAAAVTGLAAVWINQVFLQSHRSEARPLAPIEISPILSMEQAGVSISRHF